MNFKTADLYDDHADQLSIAEPGFRAFGAHHVFAGPVATVKVHEDNVLVKQALGEPGKGHVLVVDGGGSMRCALLGDLLRELAPTGVFETVEAAPRAARCTARPWRSRTTCASRACR